MNDQPEQPLPNDEPLTLNQEEDAESEENKPESKVVKLLNSMKKFTGDTKKAKLVLTLFGVTAVSVSLLLVLSLFTRRPSQEPVPAKAQPTLQPSTATPTPGPKAKEQEINKLLEDINKFDPEQKDLKFPVVDLKISL